MYCGHVGSEDARGNCAGKVCDGGDAAVFAQKVAELAAVAKNGKALDFFQGVGADKLVIGAVVHNVENTDLASHSCTQRVGEAIYDSRR